MPVPTLARSPGAMRRRLRRAQVPAGVVLVRAPARGAASERRWKRRSSGLVAVGERPLTERARRAANGGRDACLHPDPRGRVLALEVAGHVVQLRQHARRARRERAARRPRAPRGSFCSMRRRSSSRPSPVEGRDRHGVAVAGADHAAARRRRAGRPCSARAAAGFEPAPISSSTSSTAAIISSSSSSGTEASTTWRIRSAFTVSSSVALNASTSWWGSFRMKPTVSVTR